MEATFFLVRKCIIEYCNIEYSYLEKSKQLKGNLLDALDIYHFVKAVCSIIIEVFLLCIFSIR